MPDAEKLQSSSELPAPLPRHLPALDGLRGIAILLVLVHTLSLLTPQPGIAAYVFDRVGQMGWTGVQLFFVLSGFLITGILLDSQRAHNYFSAFYARRTLRIFPLYFSVLLVAFVILPAFGIVPQKVAQDQPHQLWLWLYLSNWSEVFGFGSKAFPHFWSLAVEEQFYLVWPLLIRPQTAQQCFRFCLAIAALSFVVRVVLLAMGNGNEVIYVNSFCRMDALALGGAAAAAFRMPGLGTRLFEQYRRVFRWGIWLALAGFLATRGFWNSTSVGVTIGYTIVAAMFALGLAGAAGAEAAHLRESAQLPWWTRALRWAPLREVGKVSYAMYVFHRPVHDHIGRPIAAAIGLDTANSLAANVVYLAATIGLTFVLALISWHAFEKHFLAMKQVFVPTATPFRRES